MLLGSRKGEILLAAILRQEVRQSQLFWPETRPVLAVGAQEAPLRADLFGFCVVRLSE